MEAEAAAAAAAALAMASASASASSGDGSKHMSVPELEVPVPDILVIEESQQHDGDEPHEAKVDEDMMPSTSDFESCGVQTDLRHDDDDDDNETETEEERARRRRLVGLKRPSVTAHRLQEAQRNATSQIAKVISSELKEKQRLIERLIADVAERNEVRHRHHRHRDHGHNCRSCVCGCVRHRLFSSAAETSDN